MCQQIKKKKKKKKKRVSRDFEANGFFAKFSGKYIPATCIHLFMASLHDSRFSVLKFCTS